MRLPIALIAATLLLPCTAHADVIDYKFTSDLDGDRRCYNNGTNCGVEVFEFQVPSQPQAPYLLYITSTSFATDDLTFIQNTLGLNIVRKTDFPQTFLTFSSGSGPVMDLFVYCDTCGAYDIQFGPDYMEPRPTLFTGPTTSPTLLPATFRGGLNFASIGIEGNFVITDITPPTVPEPSSLALLGTGALGILAAARRRFRQ